MDRAQRIDVAIALPILALGVLEAVVREHTDRWLVAAAVNGVAVALRRRQPLGALAAVVIVQALAHDQTYDTDPLSPFLAELILMFTVSYQLPLKPALAGYGIGLAYVIVDFSSGRIQEIAQAGAQSGFYLLAWGAGRALRGHEERREAAERHVVRVELEREEQARAAVVEERARIARELHDAVAHSVSVMVLQAGGVRRLLGSDPEREREREALAGVEETGRQAVHELHRMLGILRKAEGGR
jgi:signal transduction histidine kinase